jgi:hypothetical protein
LKAASNLAAVGLEVLEITPVTVIWQLVSSSQKFAFNLLSKIFSQVPCLPAVLRDVWTAGVAASSVSLAPGSAPGMPDLRFQRRSFDFRKSLKVLAVLMPVSVTCAFRLMLSRSASLARTRNLLQSQSLDQGAVYMNKFSRCCCKVAASPISLLFSAPSFAQWQSAVDVRTLLQGMRLLSMLLLALQCTLLPLLAAPC